MLGHSLPFDTWIALTENDDAGFSDTDAAADTETSLLDLGGFLETVASDFLASDDIDQAQQDEVFGVITSAWQTYPLITFREDPYQDTRHGDTVYVYNIVPNVSHIEPFFRQIQNEAQTDVNLTDIFDPDEIEAFLDNDLEDLIDDLTTAEEYYDMHLYIRPDGSLQTIVAEAAIRASEEMSEQIQFRLQLRTTYDATDSTTNIEVPTEAQTLEDVIAAMSEKPEVPEEYQDIPDFSGGMAARAPEFLALAQDEFEQTGSYDVCEALSDTLQEEIRAIPNIGSGGSSGSMGSFYLASYETNDNEHILGCVSSDIGYSLVFSYSNAQLYCIDDQGTELFGHQDDQEFGAICLALGGGEMF